MNAELAEPPALRRLRTRRTAQGPAKAVPCPVCAGIEGSARAYIDRTFRPGASIPAIAERIADDLGFCERHGRALANDSVHSTGIGAAFSAAIERIEPLLQERVVDERCERLFFSAGRRCPACSAEEAAAARLLAPLRQRWLRAPGDAGEVETLCWGHFGSLASRLAPEPRGRLIQQYLGVLGSADEALARNAPASLTRALIMLRGHDAGFEAAAQVPESGNAARRVQDLLAAPDRCPTCEAIGDARRRWLQGLRWVAAHESAEYLWLFAPCCPRHLADAAALDSTRLLHDVATFVIVGIAEQLRQQLACILQELALAQQPKPLWYRSRPRRRVKAAPAATLPPKRFVLRCRGCESEAIALERASSDLLDQMRSSRGRDLLARGHGLCLRHLAHVLPVAPSEDVRSYLARSHAERLRRLRAETASTASGSVPSHALVYRFRGWPG